MKLFGRAWSVQIDRTDFSDFDMAFTAVKTTKPEPNTCELHIYNLSEQRRAALEATPMVKLPKGGKQHEGIPTRITAGYEEAESLIWSGDLRTVESTHDGTEWVTTITSGDGEEAYRKSRVNLSFGPGTPIVTVVRKLAEAVGLGAGNVDIFAPKLATNATLDMLARQGLVLSGSAAEQLTHIARAVGLEWSIQDGAIQFIDHGEPLLGRSVLLSASTGLVGEPTIDQEGVLTATMLMIPDVTLGGVVVLDSERIKGNFKIVKATYEGDTSDVPWYITIEAESW